MGRPDRAREDFVALVERPDDEIDLLRAALLIAAEEYPDLDVRHYVDEFGRLASGAPPVAFMAPAAAHVGELSAYFAGVLGFQGNADDYYDPRNSFLNEVIDRRQGIPITLSVVYLALGRRVGLPLVGIGLPGHFLVGYRREGETILIDAFDRGRVLDRAAVAARLAQVYGRDVPLRPAMLRPVGARAILFRMLANLKGIYASSGDHERALGVVERMVILAPANAVERRDRGLLRARLGLLKPALGDLAAYVDARPQAKDREIVRRQMTWLEQMLVRRN